MVIKTTGPISLLDIQNEFGGSAPIGLNEYYGAAAGIPGSGTIGLNVFYGASAIVLYTHTITTNQQELNLYNYLIAQGWNGSDEVEVTINSGVYIWSDNTAVAALNTGGAYPKGLTIINNGFIMGKGGKGSDLFAYNSGFVTSVPGAGGPAINLTTPVNLNNTNGYIGGGGGGGAVLDVLVTSCAGGGAGGGLGGTLGWTNSAVETYNVAPPPAPAPGQKGTANFFAEPNFPAHTAFPAPDADAGGASGCRSSNI